jgi:hypothetical protein
MSRVIKSSLIKSTKVISEPNAHIKVTTIQLTEDGKKLLRTKARKI